MGLDVREQHVTTTDGWSLGMRRTISKSHLDTATKPLLIVPGYGMNSFIFSYHPRGTSMERALAEGGFEVWAVDMRGQGQSQRSRRKAGSASLRNYASIDVPAAVKHVLANTTTTARTLTLIGCSLGGSIAYSYLALFPDHSVAELIAMGAPLRWTQVHPLIRAAFISPALVRFVRFSRTRQLLRAVFPVLKHLPKVLSLYMNVSTIDTRHIYEMTRTVEDPNPRVNRDIAYWIRNRDMKLGGVNITEALRNVELPLLLVVPNKDGIVPESSAMSAQDAWGGEVDVLNVGDDENWFAHANLFVADDAPELVFEPMIKWLRR